MDGAAGWGGDVHAVSVSSVLRYAPLPYRTSLTESEFKDEIIKIFKKTTAKRKTSVGPLRAQGSEQLHRMMALRCDVKLRLLKVS